MDTNMQVYAIVFPIEAIKVILISNPAQFLGVINN